MRKYARLFSFITLMMFTLNIVIAQPLLAAENGTELPSEELPTDQIDTIDPSLLDEEPVENSGQENVDSAEFGYSEEEPIENIKKGIKAYTSEPESEDFTGTANYSIPIDIPPGRAGIQPNVSIKYNSGAGNGWLGLGFDLDFGHIKRITNFGLNYGAKDFEVSGPLGTGELIEKNLPGEWGDGFYGFKREDSFIKFNNPDLNPNNSGWIATTRDGTKYSFGTDIHSRQEISGSVLKWCLDRVEDRNGNYLTIQYFKENGEIYPARIDYTANINAGGASNYHIEFIRKNREDVLLNYRNHFLIKTEYILDSIKIYENNSLLKEHKLSYELNLLRKNRLKSVQELSPQTNESLPPISFKWMDGSQGQYNTDPKYYKYPSSQKNRLGFIDINSDGLVDRYENLAGGDFNSHPTKKIYNSALLTFGLGDETLEFKEKKTIKLACTGRLSLGLPDIWFVQLNGDSKIDINIRTQNNKPSGEPNYSYYNYVSDGNFNFHKIGGGTPGTIGKIDVNGDGFLDLVGEISGVSKTHLFSQLSKKDGTFGNLIGTKFNKKLGNYSFHDANGDGLADIINYIKINKKRYHEVYFSKGNGTFIIDPFYYNTSNDPPNTCYSCKPLFEDQNEDGFYDSKYSTLTGILHSLGSGRFYLEYKKLKLWSSLSTGNGSFTKYPVDLVFNPATDGIYNVLGGDNRNSKRLEYIDFNGEGVSDLTFITTSGGDGHRIKDTHLHIYKSKKKINKDLLAEIDNNRGIKYTVDYEHTKKSEKDFLPFPVYKVSSITTTNQATNEIKKTSFKYKGGFYDDTERDFRGFKKVTRTNPDGTKVETTFHQDKFLKGKKKSVIVKSNAVGNPEISRTTYTWEPIPETNTWGHIKLNKKETIFDGNTAHRTTDTYDRYNPESGQLEQMTVTGTRTDGTTTDPIVHTYAYENLDTAGWMWRLKEETLTGRVDAVTPSGVVRKTAYTYYPTTNADGTFGDLQYEDHYSDTTSYIRTEYKYDSYGNVTSQIDPKGYVTTFVYDLDTHTYPETITNPKGHVIQKKWDYRFGVEKSVTDENGHTTTFTYDPFGRMIQSDFPDGGQTLIEYNDTDIPNWVKTRQKENTTDYTETYEYFDGFGRSVQAVSKGSPSNIGTVQFIVSKTHYDNMGRVWLSTGPFYLNTHLYQKWADHSQYPLGSKYHYTQTEYDAEGRPVKIESPDDDNLHIITKFDYTGFDTTITDPDGYQKTEHKDHLGQIVQVTEHDSSVAADHGITRYEYNAAGDLICVKNALWSTTNDTAKTKTVITYDNLGRKTAMQDPDMGAWTYTYDANGNLIEQLDNKGQKSTFTYDKINRILRKKAKYPSGITHAPEDVIYTYDDTVNSLNGMGRLSRIINGTSLIPPITGSVFHMAETVYNSYDTMGRVLKVSKKVYGSGHKFRTTEYTYDLAGKTEKIAYPHAPAGKKLNVLYTFYPGSGLIKDVNSTLDGVAHTHFATLGNYTPVGKIGKITFGNGVVTDYTYDDFSFRMQHIVTKKGTTELMNKGYYYYPSGDMKRIDDEKNIITREYTYDHLHRLKTETSTAMEKFKAMDLDFVYDDADLTVPLHAPVNVKTTFAGVSKDHLYTYDENGNTLQSWDFRFPKNAIKRHINNWTPDNMPKKVEMGRVNEAEVRSPVLFKYDGEGKRVLKEEKHAGINKYDYTYYYFDHYEVLKRDGASEGRRYIFAGNLRIARYLNNTHIAYFHKDHLGSTTVTTDVNGKDIEGTDYLPFGGNRSHTGIVRSDYKFTDQEKDAEIGLYNYDARLYDPMIGRFISADTVVPGPLNPQSHDRYNYCQNNPIKYVDPSGHAPEEGEKWGTDKDYKKWANEQESGQNQRFETMLEDPITNGGISGAGDMNPALDAIAEEAVLVIATLGGSLFKSLFEEVAEIALKKVSTSITIRRRPGQLNLRIEAKPKPKPKEKVNYLYQKVDASGKHLKYGKTDNLKTRYTKKELNGGRLRVLEKGPKEEILKLERKLHENLPIGIEEHQKIYIEIQKRKGLKPPPY